MPTRALIVAIEDYPRAAGLANSLPGTRAAAEAFRNWLIEKKKLDPRDIFACIEGVAWRTAGTSRREIIDEIVRLRDAGRDDTEELYFYYSGHGFSYPRSEWQATDILVAADFVSLAVSGDACMKLQEVLEKLCVAMGPGMHYSFIDACRTEVPWGSVEPLPMGVVFTPSELGRASRSVLFSVVQGLAARTASDFSKYLIAGLNGLGRAKGWSGGSLWVQFDLLCQYLARKIKQPVEPETRGLGDGLILKLEPVPREQCRIKVQNADPADEFRLKVSLRDQVYRESTFAGPDTFQFDVQPEDYAIEVTHRLANVERIQPPPPALIDLYDPIDVLFVKRPLGFAGRVPYQTTGKLTVRGAPNAELRVTLVSTGISFLDDREKSLETLTKKVFPGLYRIELAEAGHVIAQRTVTIEPGSSVDVDMLEAPPSPLRDAIRQFVAPGGGRGVHFSEALGGPTGDRDLGLWLALLGASRIVGAEGGFSELARVPLKYRFKDLAPGSAPLYVLGGFKDQPGAFAVGRGIEPAWSPTRPVDEVPGLFEHFDPSPEVGPLLVSLQARGEPPVTISTYALPNRATFLILIPGRSADGLRVYQCLLPIYELRDHIDPRGREQIDGNPLKSARDLILAQRAFARDLPVVGTQQYPWADLTRGQGLDPILALIAAYDLLRRGLTANERYPLVDRGLLPGMIGNLRTSFGGIPDIEAIARRIGLPWSQPTSPPILLASVNSFDGIDERKFLPLPTTRLDYGAPWVEWVHAVVPYYPMSEGG